MINKLWQIVNIYLENRWFWKKKTFWPLFFFNSVFFQKKNMFFIKKTEHVFFQENTNPELRPRVSKVTAGCIRKGALEYLEKMNRSESQEVPLARAEVYREQERASIVSGHHEGNKTPGRKW